MEEYYKLADVYDYRVFSVIVENRHGGVNQHNVPEDKIELMKKVMTHYLLSWNWLKIVFWNNFSFGVDVTSFIVPDKWYSN